MDFRELPEDGQAFEQLVRELMFSLGLNVEWSGRGPDGGKDILCKETLKGHFAQQTRTWLVQCKHNAHSGSSVSGSDLDEIVTSCTQHNATGFILACTTQPSSAVVNRLEAISANPSNPITAVFWDAVTIQRLLSQPRQWAIAQRFMPRSTGSWLIYATEAPNDFVAHYSGYVFHLTNRIGSSIGHQLKSIENRISELEAIELPFGHFIRPRAVWYDDKGASYTWYIDYMRPDKEDAAIGKSALLVALRDGWALEDGQAYNWDINFVRYLPWSDHYDKDHYGYYTKYLPNFLGGTSRNSTEFEQYWATAQELEELDRDREAIAKISFDALAMSAKKIPYARLLSARNCAPEVLTKFEKRFVWTDVLDHLNVNPDNILTATLIFRVTDQNKFLELLSRIPNSVNRHFRVSRVFVFMPGEGHRDEPDETIFDLRLMLHPMTMTNERAIRKAFNSYFDEIAAVFLQEQ